MRAGDDFSELIIVEQVLFCLSWPSVKLDLAEYDSPICSNIFWSLVLPRLSPSFRMLSDSPVCIGVFFLDFYFAENDFSTPAENRYPAPSHGCEKC